MKPRSSLLTIGVVLAGACIGAAILLLLRDGQADNGAAPTPSAPHEVPNHGASAVLEGTEPVDDRLGDAEAERQPPLPDKPVSRIAGFLELRGSMPPAAARAALDTFVAEPRDPAWSSGMEARFQSELSQSPLLLTESYVECRRSRCIVLLIRPPAARQQAQELEPLVRAAASEQARLAQTLGLLGGPAFSSATRDASLVQWHTFHRRCGPEWKCLE